MGFGKTAILAVLAAVVCGQQGVAWSDEGVSEGEAGLWTAEPNRENGGFLELGVTFEAAREGFAAKNPDSDGDFELEAGFVISAGYQYDRFFFEFADSLFGGLNLGVSLLQTDRLNVDFLLANVAGRLSSSSMFDSDDSPAPVTEQERNDAILDRDTFYVAGGARITAFHGDSLLQVRLLSDWYDDNGVLGSAWLGHQWQVGNWNLQGIVGARYFSSKFNNYMVGVTEAEASQRFPRFSAGSAWLPQVEFSASVPLSQNWLFNSRLQYDHLPNAMSDSPLVAEVQQVNWITGIHYVF